MRIKQKITTKQRLFIYLISGIIIILIYNLLVLNFSSNNRPDRIVSTFQVEFLQQQEQLADKSGIVSEILKNQDNNHWPALERAVDGSDLIAQIYLNDSLYFWNSQKISNDILGFSLLYRQKDTVLLQNTGWYLLTYSVIEDYKIFLFKQIKPEFSYNNSYLPQHLTSDFGSSERIQLSPVYPDSEYTINDLHGHPILGVTVTHHEHFGRNFIFILFGLVVLFYLLIIFSLSELYDFFNRQFKNEILTFLFFAVDLFIIRALDHYFQIPFVVKQSFIFQEGSDLIFGWRSVGGQFLNTLIISAIGYKAYAVTKRFKASNKVLKSSVYRIISSLLFWIIPFLIFYLIQFSFLSLEYSPLFGVRLNDINGYILLINTILLLISLYFYQSSFGYILYHNKKTPYVPVFIAFSLGLLAWFVLDYHILTVTTTLFSVLMLITGALPEEKQDVKIAKYIFITVIISISAASLINFSREVKREHHQELAASFVSISEDEEFENHFNSVSSALCNDQQLYDISIDTTYTPEQVLNYIETNYFADFKDKYEMQVTICELGQPIELTLTGEIVDCMNYFDETIYNWGTPVKDSSLFLLYSSPSNLNYMGKLVLNNDSEFTKQSIIYLEFLYYIIPEGLGYPELLVGDYNKKVDLTGYSYAIYEDNRLLYKLGEFPYYTSFSPYSEFPDNKFYKYENYKHYQFKTETGNYLIVSRPITKISEQLVTFSALFICFVIITFFVFIGLYGGKGREQLTMNFRGRLQLVFISTISFIISLLALITLFYVESNNEQNLLNQLTEKTTSVIVELEHKLEGIDNHEDMNPFLLEELLKKFSLVFFSDINLYNPSGQMLASSRPEIFNKGLISENINPMAYEELFVKHKLFFFTNEKIGTASYYSAYAPLMLGTDRTVCILNLPYFAKQSEVRSSYFRMLFTFINVFVIFGVIGAFLSLFLTRILAKPLLMLQTNIGNIRIDQKNEKIVWNRSDEIGLLIEEYNKMVDKLEQSAELLKHSERESTWREVAQQIAHEIKNPLTPMKLNVQYLEKAYNENDPAFKTRIKNVSASLISQIDALDKVAEMFSDFAKSNAANFEKVDLEKVVRSTVALFKGHSWVTFNVEVIENGKPYIVNAIEKDLVRVFNNILKNAIQAMEDKKEGEINIIVQRTSPYIEVIISDTGKGIPPHEKASIFQPYFTTKSKGTGLGLAIVKNIMAEIGGEIGFESLDSGGTSFILKFKEAG